MKKLTEKQERFIDYKVIIGNKRLLVYNKKINIPPQEQTCIIIDSLAILLSDEIKDYNRKKAAILLLKALLPNYKEILSVKCHAKRHVEEEKLILSKLKRRRYYG
jgi:predicted metal-dependent hydrolase